MKKRSHVPYFTRNRYSGHSCFISVGTDLLFCSHFPAAFIQVPYLHENEKAAGEYCKKPPLRRKGLSYRYDCNPTDRMLRILRSTVFENADAFSKPVPVLEELFQHIFLKPLSGSFCPLMPLFFQLLLIPAFRYLFVYSFLLEDFLCLPLLRSLPCKGFSSFRLSPGRIITPAL